MDRFVKKHRKWFGFRGINNKKAFTLIELLVVIGIIGILSSITLVVLNEARNRAKNASIMEELNRVKNIAEMIRIDTENFDDLCDTGNLCTNSLNCPGNKYTSQLKLIESEVIKQGGSINCYTNTNEYCVSSSLNKETNYYCIDVTGYAGCSTTACAIATLTYTSCP